MSKYYGEHTKGCQCIDCVGEFVDLVQSADAYIPRAKWSRDSFDSSNLVLIDESRGFQVLARIVPFHHGVMSGYAWTVYGKPTREGLEETLELAKQKAVESLTS